MEKRTLLAIVLTLSVLTIYNIYSSKKTTQNIQKGTAEELQPVDIKGVAEPSPTEAISPVAPLPPSLPVKEAREERIQTIESDQVKVEISNIGAEIKTATLPPYDHHLPITDLFEIPSLKEQSFQLEKATSSTASYFIRTKDFLIGKKYSFSQDGQVLFCDIIIKNISLSPKLPGYQLNFFTIDADKLRI